MIVDIALYVALPDRYEVLGLAAGHACSFVAGLLICSRVLSRRIGGLDGGPVIRTAVRSLAAALPAGGVAAVVVAVVVRLLGAGQVGSLTALLTGSAVLAAGYVALARRMRVAELDEVVGPVLARLGLSRGP